MRIQLNERYLVAFYDWCVAESRAELLRDYSTLRSLPNAVARKYVGFMESLPAHFRAKAALGIIRRYHPMALKLMGEIITEEDRHWIDCFLHFGKVGVFPRQDAVVAGPDVYSVLANYSAVGKKRLKKEVLTSLSDQGFTPEPFGGKTVWRFIQLEEYFSLQTYIDFGKRIPLSYGQRVLDNNGKTISASCSLMQWHGITANTNWDLLTNGLITEAAKTLAELCSKFSIAFRQLILTASPECPP